MEMAVIAKAEGTWGRCKLCFRELCHCACLPAWIPVCVHNGAGAHYPSPI